MKPTEFDRRVFIKAMTAAFGALGLFGCGGSLAATTYFVRKDGSNSNTGLTNTPGGAFLTIQKAASVVVAGDTVSINAGTYAETVTLSTSGTSTSRISYKGVGIVKLDSFYITGSYMDITNFSFEGIGTPQTGRIEFPGNGTNGNIHVSYITATGVDGVITEGAFCVLSYGAITNCEFDHFTITNHNRQAYLLRGSDHKVHHWNIRGANGWDGFFILSSNTVISDCEVSVSNLYGSQNHCDIFQSFNDGGDMVAQNVVLENNYFHDCNGDVQLGIIADSVGGGAISHWIIRNNLIVNVERAFYLGAPDVQVYNNTFVRSSWNQGQVIYAIWNKADTEKSRNLKIFNNIFYKCGFTDRNYSGWWESEAFATDQESYNNLILGTGAGTAKDLDHWRTVAMGGRQSLEANTLNGVDPQFVDEANGDYTLKAGSQAQVAGMGRTFPTKNAKALFGK